MDHDSLPVLICLTKAYLYYTQARKQTVPPSDSDAVLYVSECLTVKYLSCKISFNVLNYVFI